MPSEQLDVRVARLTVRKQLTVRTAWMTEAHRIWPAQATLVLHVASPG